MRQIYAKNTEDGTWKYLDLYSREEFLQTKVPDRKNRKIISYAIRQAKEYYDSATNTSYLTQPLLMYYGMLNLAAALIRFKRPNANPRNAHGLQIINTEYRSLLTMSCKVNTDPRKTFRMFAEVADYDLARHLISYDGVRAIRDQDCKYKNLRNLKRRYSISELLVLLPELYDLLFDATSLVPRTVPLQEIYYSVTTNRQRNEVSYSNGSLIFRHGRKAKIKRMIRSFETKKDLKDWTFYEDSLDIFKYKKENASKTIYIPELREGIYRDKYAVLPERRSQYLSEAVVHFLIMFTLGSVARYKPHLWGKMMESRGREARVIEAFLDTSLVKFPLIILRYFMEELIYFSNH